MDKIRAMSWAIALENWGGQFRDTDELLNLLTLVTTGNDGLQYTSVCLSARVLRLRRANSWASGKSWTV